jgi:hypothetical protein
VQPWRQRQAARIAGARGYWLTTRGLLQYLRFVRRAALAIIAHNGKNKHIRTRVHTRTSTLMCISTFYPRTRTYAHVYLAPRLIQRLVVLMGQGTVFAPVPLKDGDLLAEQSYMILSPFHGELQLP